ncbi:cation transporter [Legionella gresilensis]|uniref:cation transporter n=1 Tax=Legionella gresilensis TaxID=91823 RepID=UPI00104147B3|nr:cation transporter [Legionella gresilensis]
MQNVTKTVEFPKELKAQYSKAIFYEWISLFYMISAATFSFLVMSNSQTMKTVWLEDSLGIIPPLSFLVASKIVNRKANKTFPYGFHRVTSMAYFTSSLALFALGIYLLIDGSIVLLKQEHPSISSVVFLNHTIWLGFLMIAALCWSSIPSTVLGHIKIPLAHYLYDKVLYADSKMNKASWTAGFASILGILGIGLGYWWADAVVGILISLSIINDGYSNFKKSILDLLDEVPKTLEGDKTDPLIQEVEAIVKRQDWVESVALRFRDEGHVFFGDIFVTSKHKSIEIKKLSELQEEIKQHHWRLNDIVIMPVSSKKG